MSIDVQGLNKDLALERKEERAKKVSLIKTLRSNWRTDHESRVKLVEIMSIHGVKKSVKDRVRAGGILVDTPEHMLPYYYLGSVMDLNYIVEGAHTPSKYREGGCWGGFLARNRPCTICIPLTKTFVDKGIIEWLINTPMLKKVLVNPDVESVLKHGFVIDTEKSYYSEWYVPAMFCRSISEQTYMKRFYPNFFEDIKDCSPFVRYWSYIAHVQTTGSSPKDYFYTMFPDVHGRCWLSLEHSLDPKILVSMPEQEAEQEDIDKYFYCEQNEVHANIWCTNKGLTKYESVYGIAELIQEGNFTQKGMFNNRNKIFVRDTETLIKVLQEIEKAGS